MKYKINASPKMPPAKSTFLQPEAFVFCDRTSGVVRFHVEAEPGGTLPLEQSASLLAIHCLVDGNKPDDYTVLVAPRTDLLNPVGSRAQELINSSQTVLYGPEMSKREQEVLECVVQNLSNKEIGSRLNVSLRTVKFHVSSLLMKFKVPNRWELIRKSAHGWNAPGRGNGSYVFPKPLQAKNEGKSEQDVAEKRSVIRMPSNAYRPEEDSDPSIR